MNYSCLDYHVKVSLEAKHGWYRKLPIPSSSIYTQSCPISPPPPLLPALTWVRLIGRPQSCHQRYLLSLSCTVGLGPAEEESPDIESPDKRGDGRIYEVKVLFGRK